MYISMCRLVCQGKDLIALVRCSAWQRRIFRPAGGAEDRKVLIATLSGKEPPNVAK